MQVPLGKARTLQRTDISAVIDYEKYVPAAFVRLRAPIIDVKSFIVADDYICFT